MKKLYIALAMAMLLALAVSFVVCASDISLLDNNTNYTNTSFDISNDGIATVGVRYDGYSNVTTSATISITIEKRNLLFFWSDVVSDTITVSGDYYSNELTYQLDGTGTYRCTVEYVVSGTGGADDVITFEDTKTYSN